MVVVVVKVVLLRFFSGVPAVATGQRYQKMP